MSVTGTNCVARVVLVIFLELVSLLTLPNRLSRWSRDSWACLLLRRCTNRLSVWAACMVGRWGIKFVVL